MDSDAAAVPMDPKAYLGWPQVLGAAQTPAERDLLGRRLRALPASVDQAGLLLACETRRSLLAGSAAGGLQDGPPANGGGA